MQAAAHTATLTWLTLGWGSRSRPPSPPPRVSKKKETVVPGIETGGRWSEEASMFVKLLAQAKARQAPPLLQASLSAAFISRWTALLSHAAMQAFAASLLAQDCSNHSNVEGNEPPLSQVLAEAPLHAPSASRLPAPS